MSKDFDVLVVGELNPDLILCGDVTPAFGQVEKLIADATLTIGSSSAICACGLARLGLKVAFIGKVGEDEFGRFMLRELAARGIDIVGVVMDPSVKTGLSVILSRGNDRAILTYGGSIGALRYDEINPAYLARARHLHLGSYFMQTALQPQVPRLFEQAARQGASVSIDTNFDPSEAWDSGLREALRGAAIFLPNETELLAITRQANVELALASITEDQSVAVKLGARGATARIRGKHYRASGVPVEVVDTTGAGDSFDAGFLYGWLSDLSPEQTLRLACVCGSLSARAAGGTAAQPTLEEARGYL